jgi:Na+/H+ antiporter NhaC
MDGGLSMKLKDWLPFIFYCLVVVVAIIFAIFYIKSVVTADIPVWLKLFLLRGK